MGLGCGLGGCGLELWAWGVGLGCGLGVWAWDVVLESGLGVLFWGVGLGCGLFIWAMICFYNESIIFA